MNNEKSQQNLPFLTFSGYQNFDRRLKLNDFFQSNQYIIFVMQRMETFIELFRYVVTQKYVFKHQIEWKRQHFLDIPDYQESEARIQRIVFFNLIHFLKLMLKTEIFNGEIKKVVNEFREFFLNFPLYPLFDSSITKYRYSTESWIINVLFWVSLYTEKSNFSLQDFVSLNINIHQ